MRSVIVLLALPSLLACTGNRVRGVVNGQKVPVRSAYFFVQDGVFGDDSLTGVVLSSLQDGCVDYGYFLTVTRDLTSPEQLASAWSAVFPADMWEVGILLRTAPASEVMTGQVYDGIAWNAGLEERGTVAGQARHITRFRDENWWDGSAPLEDYGASFDFHSGTLMVESHQPGQRLAGNYTTSTMYNGDPTGVLNIDFNAVFCPEADLLP